MWFADRPRELIGTALLKSVLGSAAVDDESGGGDLVDFEPVRPRKTLAMPLGRMESGDETSSPGCGDMCSS